MKKKLVLKSLLTLALIVALITTVAGCAGEPGLKGSQGEQGIQGEQGEQGPAGLTGSQGKQGLQGEPGPKGSTGAKGATGSTGAQGAKGEQGEQGPRGPGGAGATGATGSTGPQGATGPAGPQGDPGSDADCGDLQTQIDALEARLDILEFVPPTIDGVLGVDEWGSPTFTYESDSNYIGTVNIYITTDSDNLYIAAEADSGDMTQAQSMGTATALNIYIDSDNSDGMPDNSDIFIIASDDGLGIPFEPAQQGWDCGTYYTYTASGAGITIAANGDAYNGAGIVEVEIPLSLLDGVGPGSTIGLCFQAFGYTKYPEGAHPDWPGTYADFTFGR